MIRYLVLKLIFLPALFLLSCTSSDPAVTGLPLENTKWILKTLNDKKIFIPESGKEVYIEFKSVGNKVNGNGGCNTFFGTYTVIKNKLKLGPISKTEIFCEGIMEVEDNFVMALEKTERYKIKENVLEIYDALKLIATLEGVPQIRTN
ncbi:MAG: META domain-containing protein [Ignavibacteria bacterium]